MNIINILNYTWTIHMYKTCLIDQISSMLEPPCLSADCRSDRRVDCLAVTSSKVGISWGLSAGKLLVDEISFELPPSVPGFLLQVLRVGGWVPFVLLFSAPWMWVGLEPLRLPLSDMRSPDFPAVNQFNKPDETVHMGVQVFPTVGHKRSTV